MTARGPARDAESEFPNGAPTPPATRITDLEQAAEAAGCRLREPCDPGPRPRPSTDTKVTYDTNPPTSGPHNPVPAEDGTTLRPSGRTRGTPRHTLEHGRIYIQYKPTIPQAPDRPARRGLFDDDPFHMVLSAERRPMPDSGRRHGVGPPRRLPARHGRDLRPDSRLPRPLSRPRPRAGRVAATRRLEAVLGVTWGVSYGKPSGARRSRIGAARSWRPGTRSCSWRGPSRPRCRSGRTSRNRSSSRPPAPCTDAYADASAGGRVVRRARSAPAAGHRRDPAGQALRPRRVCAGAGAASRR